MDQSTREVLSPPFEPPAYSINFADDGTLEWDPPIGSAELALTLSYHFPLQRTLAEKMQAATGAWLKQQQKTKVLSPDGGPNTVDGNPSRNSKPSKIKMIGLQPAMTIAMDNISFSKVPQSLPAHKRANERARLQARKSVAATTTKLEVPGMVSWRVEGGSFALGRRKKRVYSDAERHEVGRNRGMVCEFHRQKKLKCDPNACLHNKLRGEGKSAKQKTKARISDSGSANASSPRKKTDGPSHEFLPFSRTTFETETQGSITQETDRSLSGTNLTSNFPSQSPGSRQSRQVNPQSGKNLPSPNQHNEPSSQEGQTPETIDSTHSLVTVNTSLSERQDVWSPSGFSPSLGQRDLSQFATVPEVYPQTLEERDMIIEVSDTPLFSDQWPENFPADSFPLPVHSHFDMSFAQTGFDGDTSWMNEYPQSSELQTSGFMDAGLDLGDLTKPFDMELPNKSSQYDQIYNPHEDNFERSSEILKQISDGEEERYELSLNDWTQRDAALLRQPVIWDHPDLSGMSGMTYQASSPMFWLGGISHYGTHMSMNDINDVNVEPPPPASLQSPMPMGDSASSSKQYNSSISPTAIALESSETESHGPSQDVPLQGLKNSGSRGGRGGTSRLNFLRRWRSRVSSDAVPSLETFMTQISRSENYGSGALQVPAAAPSPSQSLHASDFMSHLTSTSAIRPTVSTQPTITRGSDEQDGDESAITSRFLEREASFGPRSSSIRRTKVPNVADGEEKDEVILSLEQSKAHANDHIARLPPQAALKAFDSGGRAGFQSRPHARTSPEMSGDSDALATSVKDKVDLAEKKALDAENKAREEMQKSRPGLVNGPLSSSSRQFTFAPHYSKQSMRFLLLNEGEARRQSQQAPGAATGRVSNVTNTAVGSGNVQPSRLRNFLGGSGVPHESDPTTPAVPSRHIDRHSNRPPRAGGRGSIDYHRRQERITPQPKLPTELESASLDNMEEEEDLSVQSKESLSGNTRHKPSKVGSIVRASAKLYDVRSKIPPAPPISRPVSLKKVSQLLSSMELVVSRPQTEHEIAAAMSSLDENSMLRQEPGRLEEVTQFKKDEVPVNDRKLRRASASSSRSISDASVGQAVLSRGPTRNRSRTQVSKPHRDRDIVKVFGPCFEAECDAPKFDLKAEQKEEENQRVAGGGESIEQNGSAEEEETEEEGVDELNNMIGGLGLFD